MESRRRRSLWAGRRGSGTDARRQQRVAEHPPVRHRGPARLDPDHLHSDMVGAGLDVGVKFRHDAVQVAPAQSSTMRSLPPLVISSSEYPSRRNFAMLYVVVR